MKAKLVRAEGTIEADGTPAELAQLFKEFCGTAWNGVIAGQVQGALLNAGTNWPPLDGVKGIVQR